MGYRDEAVISVYPPGPGTWLYNPQDRDRVELPGVNRDRLSISSPERMLFPAPWQTDVDYLPIWGK